MSDTRVQAANLLCKIFLHYLVLLSEWDGMLDLWLRILDIMDRLMNSGQGDNLEEAVPESLKNILLVMADGGFIAPPEKGKPSSELWEETCKRVDRFLPDLIREIFPQAYVKEEEKEERPPNVDGGADEKKEQVGGKRSSDERTSVERVEEGKEEGKHEEAGEKETVS